MITLCSVILDGIEEYLDIFIESTSKLNLVKEVILVKIDDKNHSEKRWEKDGKIFRQIGIDVVQPEYGHALGLHVAINNSQESYVMFSDPDVFFYTNVDQFYFDLLQKYNLNYIGCSHHAAVAQAYSFFPHFVSSLVKKDDLPKDDFLKGKLKYRHGVLRVENLKDGDPGEITDGKYLLPSPIPELYQNFPNTSAHYDVGCNLWLWAQEKKWKWLAFQTTDCHLYTPLYNRGNVKIQEKLPKLKLIYHGTNGSRKVPEELSAFKEAYEDSVDD